MDETFDPLCELEFTETQTGRKVEVRLGAPTFDAIKNDWYCFTEVVGLVEGTLARTYSSDPFHAIGMSFVRFRVIFERQSGEFRSATGASPHVYFPKYIPWIYGDDVYERICKLVDEEVQKIEDERTKRRERRNPDDGK